MKTLPCYPKVIIHRLGEQPAPRRRFFPLAALLLLLPLAIALASGVFHPRPRLPEIASLPAHH